MSEEDLEVEDEPPIKRELSAIFEDNEDSTSYIESKNLESPSFLPNAASQAQKESNGTNSLAPDSYITSVRSRKYGVYEGVGEQFSQIPEPDGEVLPTVGSGNEQRNNAHLDEHDHPDLTVDSSLSTSPYLTEDNLRYTASDDGGSTNVLKTNLPLEPSSTIPTNTATNDEGYNGSTASGGYISEAGAYKLHMQSTSGHVTEVNMALGHSGYIPSNISTASSGYASECSYKSRVQSTSDDVTDTNVAPSSSGYIPSDFSTVSSGYGSQSSYKCRLQSTLSYVTDPTVGSSSSGYIPSNMSTVSSGYGSEAGGVSVHKYGSVTSQLSCGTPRMPHFNSEWANGEYVPTTGQSGSQPAAASTAPSQEVSDKESSRPVTPLSLVKDTKCDDVSLDSPICVGTPDGYVDSVFDDTPLTKCPPNLQEDLKSKHPTSGTDHSKGGHYVTPVTSGDYIPYPSHNESTFADPSSHTEELTLCCETCYTQDTESTCTNSSYIKSCDSQVRSCDVSCDHDVQHHRDTNTQIRSETMQTLDYIELSQLSFLHTELDQTEESKSSLDTVPPESVREQFLTTSECVS